MPPPDPGLAAARTAFDRIAAGTLTGADPGIREIALTCGYSAAELASVPVAANLGLACGHPLAFADVEPGETVVDLGCGGGMDVLLAAQRVGSGRVIGFDLSPEMVERANINLQQRRAKGQSIPAEFQVAGQEALPLEDGSVDCVLSNGAFRYAHRKKQVLGEVFRVLKPGGRVSFGDLAWRQTPSDEIWDARGPAVCGLEWMPCVSDLEAILSDHGFTAVRVTATPFDLRAYSLPVQSRESISDARRLEQWVGASQGCCDIDPEGTASAFHEGFATIVRRPDVTDFVTAVQIQATKPGERSRP